MRHAFALALLLLATGLLAAEQRAMPPAKARSTSGATASGLDASGAGAAGTGFDTAGNDRAGSGTGFDTSGSDRAGSGSGFDNGHAGGAFTLLPGAAPEQSTVDRLHILRQVVTRASAGGEPVEATIYKRVAAACGQGAKGAAWFRIESSYYSATQQEYIYTFQCFR